VPAAEAFTLNCTYAPDAFVPLQNPLPEKGVQSESMVPWQVAFSAS